MNTLLYLDIGAGELIIIMMILVYAGLFLYCLIDIARSTFPSSTTKILWIAIIFFAPFLGSLLYLVLGRNTRI